MAERGYDPLSAEHQQPEQRCPHCFYRMDTASGVASAAPPEEGDFSLCLNCGAILVFGHHLILRALRKGELEAVPPELLRQLGAVRRAHAQTKARMGDLAAKQRRGAARAGEGTP